MWCPCDREIKTNRSKISNTIETMKSLLCAYGRLLYIFHANSFARIDFEIKYSTIVTIIIWVLRRKLCVTIHINIIDRCTKIPVRCNEQTTLQHVWLRSCNHICYYVVLKIIVRDLIRILILLHRCRRHNTVVYCTECIIWKYFYTTSVYYFIRFWNVQKLLCLPSRV